MGEIPLKKLEETLWEIPLGSNPGMKVPGWLFSSEPLIAKIRKDRTLNQLLNMTQLPGIYRAGLAMPDAHEGYGFPIGGVAALDFEEGGISPGGIGFDINCGVRVLSTSIPASEVKPKIKTLLEELFKAVPSGVGRHSQLRLGKSEVDEVLKIGSQWAVEHGMGVERDIEHTEERGRMPQADPSKVSDTAKRRGSPQVGTLGAGNHFLEIQEVGKIFNPAIAKTFGLVEGNTTIMIHCGSRGLGHQVCTDYLRRMEKEHPEILEKIPDRELVYAPAGTRLASDYLAAMAASANYAWANRQTIMHQVRKAFAKVFETDWEKLEMNLIYDVCHNICKVETHNIGGVKRKVYLHRKGATRAFPPGSSEIPAAYREVGQPAILPGSMGTASYIMNGVPEGERAFYSTAHGAGRAMSRSEASRKNRGESVAKQLEEQGILVKCQSWRVLSEEAPSAYKNVDDVAQVADAAKLAALVARLRPLGVVKG